MPETRICKSCAEPFDVGYPSDPEVFCSRKCWRDYVTTHKSPRNQRVPITCTTCGKQFDVKPCRLNERKYCSRDCQTIGRRRQRQKEIEQQFGKSIFTILYDLYCIQELGIKQIAKRIGVSDRNLWDWFDDLGIERRERSDAVALQWAGNEERKAAQKDIIRRAIERGTFDPQRIARIAKTDWARKRNSESKMGDKNWAHHHAGPLSPNWNGGKIYYYGESWHSQRNAARNRDNYTCQHCGITETILGKQLDVHHIRKFRLFGVAHHKEANHLSNLICLCPACHVIAEAITEQV